jgi:hypothetical protein
MVTETEQHPIPIDQSNINAKLELEHRKKGLLWYSTYKVDFDSSYKLTNNTGSKQTIHMNFPLPAEKAIYDNFQLRVGKDAIKDTAPSGNSVSQLIVLQPGETQTVAVKYDSQGLDSWHYNFGGNISQVKDFTLNINTNFDAIDFPQGSISPTQETKSDHGWRLTWNYKNLLTGYNIGVSMPAKLNPGPWVSKVTFFAPVSLFLFFFLLFVFTTVKGIRIHPMNYFFVGSAFFSFHLLMAYLVDHISVELAFAISSVVSVFLVVSYMRLVVSTKFAMTEVALAQLIYLVLFSYTFFFEQYTGLSITIMCILTLFVMMQFTGRIDWSEAFRKASTKSANTAT